MTLFLTTNPKARPTQLEAHLRRIAQDMARKNYRLAMIADYLEAHLDEWKLTRDKYRNTGTAVAFQNTSSPVLEVKNSQGEVVFTVK